MSWKQYGIEEKDLLVPASILIGAILISVSIFYSSDKLPWTTGNKFAVAQNNGQAPAGDNGDVILAARKDAPSIGTGKLEIVEFSDFQCPFCEQFFSNAYKDIKSKYIDTGKAKLVYRYLPLSFHQNAEKAAEAAECAYRQGKFEEYHNKLFTLGKSDGTGLAVADLKKYAGDLGLDTSKFNQCLDNGEAVDVIKKDIAAASSAGVNGTPTFIINGKKIVGAQPFANFQPIIDAALK
jgi:protein-disulfide isomerase